MPPDAFLPTCPPHSSCSAPQTRIQSPSANPPLPGAGPRQQWARRATLAPHPRSAHPRPGHPPAQAPATGQSCPDKGGGPPPAAGPGGGHDCPSRPHSLTRTPLESPGPQESALLLSPEDGSCSPGSGLCPLRIPAWVPGTPGPLQARQAEGLQGPQVGPSAADSPACWQPSRSNPPMEVAQHRSRSRSRVARRVLPDFRVGLTFLLPPRPPAAGRGEEPAQG